MPNRRGLLRIGTVSLAAPWSGMQPAAAAGRARARACLLVYLDGGPSRLDMGDLKPEAPAEVRGPFRPIPTTVPGVQVCEHLPRRPRQMHRIAQVRSVRHEETIHDPAATVPDVRGRRHRLSAGRSIRALLGARA